MSVRIITSLLDNDLYKFTMQQAVFNQYPHAVVKYKFINRGNSRFGSQFVVELRKQIEKMADIKLFDEEYQWLKSTCYYFKPTYLDFLRGFRFDPSEVRVALEQSHPDSSPNSLDITIEGPWYRTILWEVPLLAMVSELNFGGRINEPGSLPCEVSSDAYIRMRDKAVQLKGAKVNFADFGTRRRFSGYMQDRLVGEMKEHAGEYFRGTSNLMLAKKHGVAPIGTEAHEWDQAHAAMYGYKMAHQMALDAWVKEYGGDLGIALSDTFTTEVFFRAFTTKFAKLFDGMRQDSGSPMIFAGRAVEHYKKHRIDPSTKTIVFSDGLTTDKAIEIAAFCKQLGIRSSFGIGTHFTNDVGAIPLNIVIKMVECNGNPTVKLSDAAGKETGDPKAIEYCKYILGVTGERLQ